MQIDRINQPLGRRENGEIGMTSKQIHFLPLTARTCHLFLYSVYIQWYIN